MSTEASLQSSRGKCSICYRSMPVRLDGLIHIHGPTDHHCAGSGLPPHSDNSVLAISTNAEDQQPDSLDSLILCFKKTRAHTIKRIPRGCRSKAAAKLSDILDNIICTNSNDAWICLFLFARSCLRVSRHGGKRWSLTTLVIHQIESESFSVSHPSTRSVVGPLPKPLPELELLDRLARRVSSKLEEGDFTGAVRLSASTDTFTEYNDVTLSALQAKHPPAHPQSEIPQKPTANCPPLTATSSDILSALRSFHKGSAGGPDGLLPQHLQDLTSPSAEAGGQRLLFSLTSFINFVLHGNVPPTICEVFFGASLTVLSKKDGGIRPIAVGGTIRRLIAKIATRSILAETSDRLYPLQLGLGVSKGSEAAVHAARHFLENLSPSKVLMKLDIKNAFNSIRRDKILEAIQVHIPQLYPLVFSSYSAPSILFFSENTIPSREGVQQGDPLGPLLFCLTIHPVLQQLSSEFKIFFLDDGTIGGDIDTVSEDLRCFETGARELGLSLNHEKSEIIYHSSSVLGHLQSAFSIMKYVHPNDTSLLGSPIIIGDLSSINRAIKERLDILKIIGKRLSKFSTQDALTLLKHAFAIPKVLYILRTAPSFLSPILKDFDSYLRSLLSEVINVDLSDDLAWLQASLPVRAGGIGIRSAVQLAPSTYLASAAGCKDIIQHLIPSFSACSFVNLALQEWSTGHSHSPPLGTDAIKQKSWDKPRVDSCKKLLLDSAKDSRSRARLVASFCKESGYWLEAPPISSLGLRLDDTAMRIAVGLRLGVPLCRPHSCEQCGMTVDELATHGLHCRKSQGHHSRHFAVNDIIHRALVSAGVPSRLEPKGTNPSDGSHPDGLSCSLEKRPATYLGFHLSRHFCPFSPLPF